MSRLAHLRAYAAHPDPATASANLIAVVVALNGPFYPLYVVGAIGAQGLFAFATMAASPLFFAVPWLSRRTALGGRIAVPLIGTINTVWCTKLFGAAAEVQLFCLPCIVLAALVHRDRETWLCVVLVGLGLLPLLLPSTIYGPAWLPIDPALLGRLVPLNAACVAGLMGLIALQFRKLIGRSAVSS